MVDQPSDEQIQVALKSSGFLFEQEVAIKLEASGFTARMGSNYIDPDEGKPREIDVLAAINYLPDCDQAIVFILSVECKSTPQPHVVFTRPWNQFASEWLPWGVNFGDLNPLVSASKINGKELKDLDAGQFWKDSGLLEVWRDWQCRDSGKGVQLVRIERNGGKFSARNSFLEMALPAIKAAHDLKTRFSAMNIVVLPVCVTGGPLRAMSPENIHSAELQDVLFLPVEYDNRSEWSGRDGSTIVNIVPYENLTEWLNDLKKMILRFNEILNVD